MEWSASVQTEKSNAEIDVGSIKISKPNHTGTNTENKKTFWYNGKQRTKTTALSASSKTSKDASKATTFWQFGAIVCCFYANMVSGGLLSSYGIMYTYMQESLGVSIFQLTWIGSLMAGFQGFTSLIATVLIDVSGCRITVLIGTLFGSVGLICSSLTSNVNVLCFTLGVLPGVGCCLSYNASMVHASRMFTRWRVLATGICVAGSAAGILSYPLLTTLMADHFGWKGSLLLHGALYLHLLPASLLVQHVSSKAEKQVKVANTSTTIRHKAKNYLKVFQQVPVMLVALAHCFIGLALPTFTTFLPEYVISGPLKLTQLDSALILSLAGFGGLFSRVMFAGVGSLHIKAPQIIYVTSLLSCGVAELFVVLNTTGLMMIVNGAAYGLAFGAFPSVACTVFVNLFGLENLSKTFGVFTFCQGIGSFCAPPLQSYLASFFNNQDLIFYIGGGAFVMAFLVVLIVILIVTPFGWSKKSLSIKRQHIIKGKRDSLTNHVSISVAKVGIINEALEVDPS